MPLGCDPSRRLLLRLSMAKPPFPLRKPIAEPVEIAILLFQCAAHTSAAIDFVQLAGAVRLCLHVSFSESFGPALSRNRLGRHEVRCAPTMAAAHGVKSKAQRTSSHPPTTHELQSAGAACRHVRHDRTTPIGYLCPHTASAWSFRDSFVSACHHSIGGRGQEESRCCARAPTLNAESLGVSTSSRHRLPCAFA